MKFFILAILLSFSISSSLKAQTLLYDNLTPQVGVSPPPTVFSYYTLDINLNGLKAFPDSLRIDFPDGTFTIVQQSEFSPRSGYVFRDDETDPPGTPVFWVNPNANPEDFSFKWTGSNEEYDVVFTVHKGQLIGYITSNSKRYGIERLNDGSTYRLSNFNLENFPQEERVIVAKTNDLNKEKLIDNTYISHLKSYNNEKQIVNKGVSTQNTVVDMLIVWTEQARIDAGGSISNPDDTQGLDTLMITAIDHANTAFANSNSTTRVTKFHTAKLNGYSLSGQGYFTDLENFRTLNSVNQLRTLVSADIVTGLITNYTLLDACGLGWVQTFPNCNATNITNCGVGSDFDDYAYNLVTRFCAIWDDTFTHEMGHLMGANHARNELGITLSNDIINNGYPEAFAWRSGSFKSIMSVYYTNSDPTTSRRLYFSNPNVFVDAGIATGVTGEAYNVNVIDSLTPTMSLFRERPDIIFANGFE